ncbi:DUF3575 domain-containing protein [Bacteroides sp. AN502(2024)]|uniref:DUF3575 domain-containing protein n=1 Tax=Bacteroides sp. AN502(2024) TaxID=3160599 RepID=UPI0035123530
MNKKNFFLLVFLLCLLVPKCSMAQSYSVRTNLAGLATGNLNMEGSMLFSMRWSAHLPIQYNPFNLWRDAKLKNITLAPGIRYWARESYAGGYFFGLHGIFSLYNAGGVFRHRYRYEGSAWGGGISAGWVRPLSRRWNLEFELGGGIVWTDWERFQCVHCGKRVGKGKGVRLVPTRTAINLVYLF